LDLKRRDRHVTTTDTVYRKYCSYGKYTETAARKAVTIGGLVLKITIPPPLKFFSEVL
jgi:hypothetical protein